MASAELEKILRKLLVPDNHIIQQATIELKTAFIKTDVVLPALVELLQNCTEPTIRQYCSILLRRRIVKQWNSVNTETKTSLKSLLLTCVTRETIPFVLGSICQVVGSIARHDFANNAWPELLQFISQCIQSSKANEREVGFTLLYAVCESASEQLKPWYKELFPVFQIGLSDCESKNNPYYAIRCICPLVQYFGSDEEVLLKPMLGEIMNAIKTLLKEDEDKANEALDIFDELVQIEVGIIVPYVKLLVEFCMQIISCNEFEEGLRVKALYLICWACRRKSKIILKEKLLKPLITQLLSLMSMPEDEEDASEDDMAEINSLQSVASQALDLLALHSPPAQLIPILMESLSSLFISANHFERKAAYIALGELAEGCADFIRTRHLKNAVETAMKGLSDQSVIVRNAALFALGQYAEHVQPDVSKLHENVIPMLLIFLQTLVNDPQPNVNHKGTITKLFYALEKFTEGLEKEVVFIYTDKLMESFLYLLKNSKDAHTSELAISAIGALATSAGEHLSNYFSVIMEHLKVYLQQPLTLENMDIIAQTVDTLGALARNIKSDIFYPVANDCIQFGIKVIEDCEDPDLKRCTYGLFSAVSFVLNDKMEFYLPSIIQAMILSLSSTDGIVATDTSNDPLFLIEDETGEEDIEDEEEENATGYTVENAYMDEKEDTINSLAELAENVGKPMMSYMEEIFKEIFLLVDYPHENVRKASVTGCCRLTSVIYKHLKENQVSDLSTVNMYIARSFPTALNVINKDDDRSVVIAVVEVLNDLIKDLKGDLFIEQQYADDLANSILNLLKGKKKNSTVAEKSFAAGTIAEIIQAMGVSIGIYVQPLTPWLVQFLQDSDEEVRSNAAFGLGVLCEHGGDAAKIRGAVVAHLLQKRKIRGSNPSSWQVLRHRLGRRRELPIKCSSAVLCNKTVRTSWGTLINLQKKNYKIKNKR
uniref:Importin-4 n=1 Tax=Hydra vulgaris TaxID=6087 RepID=T2M8R0_HYDVU